MYEYNLQTWPSSKNPIIQLYIHETPLVRTGNFIDIETIEQELNERFAAPLPEYYNRSFLYNTNIRNSKREG